MTVEQRKCARALIEGLQHAEKQLEEVDVHAEPGSRCKILLCVHDADQALKRELMRRLGWVYDGDTSDWTFELEEY